MKKFYRILLLLIILIFLSTYNPTTFDLWPSKKNNLFKITNIEITDNFIIKKKDIKTKLNHIYKKNIFYIRKIDIEKPLEKIDFLEKIEVKKKYPNTIIIKTFETKPVALYFKNGTKYIIDSLSNLILFESDKHFINLPNVFGKDAENHFLNFVEQLKKNNFPIKEIKNFYYFQIARWDLELFNNKIIKLPQVNTSEAIIKSIELLNREDFKNYNIIDLRVNGKIIVE